MLLLSFLNSAVTPGLIAPVTIYCGVVMFIFVLTTIYSMRVPTTIVVEIKFFHYLALFISLYSVISILWSKDIAVSARYVYFFISNWFVFYLFSFSINSEEKLNLIFKLLLYCLLIQVFIGLAEILLGVHLPNSRQYVSSFSYDDIFVPTGSFYNENNYASALSFGAGFFIVGAFLSKKNLIKILYIVPLLITIILINKTESRINQLAILLSFFITLYVIIIKDSTYISQKAKMLFLNLSILISAVVLVVLFYENLTTIINELFFSESADAVRYHLAVIAISTMIDSNYFGAGPGAFELSCFTAYSLDTRDVCNPHNWLLELGANFGLFILLAQLYIYIKLFRLAVKSVLNVKEPKVYFIGLSLLSSYPGAVLSGVSISSIIGYSLVWCYLGIVLAYINIVKDNGY